LLLVRMPRALLCVFEDMSGDHSPLLHCVPLRTADGFVSASSCRKFGWASIRADVDNAWRIDQRFF
jgi:hypothetical protein